MLDRIMANKKQEIEGLFKGISSTDLKLEADKMPPVRDFRAALSRDGVSLIAEIKPASPNRGVLVSDIDPAAIASVYEKAGADAISVLTDRVFFDGDISYICAVRDACCLPILRKDFIIDSRQVYESRIAGADAVLLIAAILDDIELKRLYDASREAGLAVLVETHTEKEIDRAIKLGLPIIGINNRDLGTFETSLAVTERLAPRAPADGILVSESGIKDGNDAARVARAGVDAVLVGEALMTAEDVAAKIKDIKGN